MAENTNQNTTLPNGSDSELPGSSTKSPEGQGSDSELTLEELSKRLDKQLEEHDETARQMEQYKEILAKQQAVIDKQMKEIKELKEKNLDMALHNSGEEHLSVEEIFAKNFG